MKEGRLTEALTQELNHSFLMEVPGAEKAWGLTRERGN